MGKVCYISMFSGEIVQFLHKTAEVAHTKQKRSALRGNRLVAIDTLGRTICCRTDKNVAALDISITFRRLRSTNFYNISIFLFSYFVQNCSSFSLEIKKQNIAGLYFFFQYNILT